MRLSQGYLLCSRLFLININDIPEVCKYADSFQIADDTIFLKTNEKTANL